MIDAGHRERAARAWDRKSSAHALGGLGSPQSMLFRDFRPRTPKNRGGPRARPTPCYTFTIFALVAIFFGIGVAKTAIFLRPAPAVAHVTPLKLPFCGGADDPVRDKLCADDFMAQLGRADPARRAALLAYYGVSPELYRKAELEGAR